MINFLFIVERAKSVMTNERAILHYSTRLSDGKYLFGNKVQAKKHHMVGNIVNFALSNQSQVFI